MRKINKAMLIVVSLILILPSFTGVKANTTENKVTTQNHNPILFLHGWTKTMIDWATMKEWFIADGWTETALYAYNFADTGSCSVQAVLNNADKVEQWVDDILTETGCKKIDLVGHSMGGHAARYYIKFLGGIDKVDDYVSLGSTHHSSRIDKDTPCGINVLKKILNEGDETPGGILNDTLGERIDPIDPEIIYNGTHVPGSINYTSIYSLADYFVPSQSSVLDGAHNIEVEDLGHSQLFIDKPVYKLVKAAIDDPHQFSTPSLIFPIGGETLSGDVNISWTASVDTWGYSVTYNVYFSTNGGTTWTLLKADLTDPSFIWDTSTVPNGSNYIFRIKAISSGKLDAIFISSSPFTVSNPTTTTTTTTTTPGLGILLLIAAVLVLISLHKQKK
ncbi:MAG: alpha/beta fold hydrolase [Candidatus Hodarchaeales archaeon]